MAQQLIPNTYRYNSAENFVESFINPHQLGGRYYVFAGNHLPYDNSLAPVIYDTTYQTEVDVYRNMIFGKIVSPQDVSLMIRRVQWTAGTVYDMYDDQDNALYAKNFFAYVTDGAYYHVFKCLSNYSGGASTVQPNLPNVGTDGIFISPVDNYIWKYMYSVDGTTFDKFSTDTFMPYVANTQVIANAAVGSIETVKIISTGSGYNNYIVSGSFSTSDIGVYSNSQNFGISVSGASATDDFYEGCILFITSGTGSGQYKRITSYQGTTTPKYAVVDSKFTVTPDNSSTYAIYPGVYINGDQSQSVNAIAWAYVSSSGNTIQRIEMLNRGLNYKVATANVYSSSTSSPISNASVRPILSPPGGHGSNPANELYCNAAAISVLFKNNESNTIPATSQYRQSGLLLDPVFSNVTLTYTTSRGSYFGGETIYNFYPRRVQNGVNITASNNQITVNEAAVGVGALDTLLVPNQMVYVSDGVSDQIFTVTSIGNSSYAVVSPSSAGDFSNATMYSLDTRSYGAVVSSTVNHLGIANVQGTVVTDGVFVGALSGGYTNSVSTITINDVTKSQDTFLETYRYTCTVASGTFTPNETIVQATNSNSNAILHSVVTSGGVTSLYVTNQNGIFNTSNTVYGSNSGAIATITNKYLPEVVFGSGRILYIENLDAPISRANNQTETFKFIFEF
jgi:hypothetical protein